MLDLQSRIEQHKKDYEEADRMYATVQGNLDRYLRKSLAIRRALLAFELRVYDQINQLDMEMSKIESDYK